MNVAGCFIDGFRNKCKEFGLVLFGSTLESQFISNAVEKSQCEQFVKRRLPININLLEDLLENDIVNLFISAVIGLFRLKNVHDTFFIKLINILENFFVNLFS